MSDADAGGTPQPAALAAVTPADEFRMRHLEAWLGFWKIVIGTGLVGIAAALFPAAATFYTSLFDSRNREIELTNTRETAYLTYIQSFAETAINQNIELRLRFALYFANVSGAEQRPLWEKYYAALKEQRDAARAEINEAQASLIRMKQSGEDATKPGEYAALQVKLDWLAEEVGYTPIQIGQVARVNKKESLYQEALAVLRRLAAVTDRIDSESADYKRFWDLYNRDLIGVESRDFEAGMVLLGRRLKTAAEAGTPPSEEFRSLVGMISAIGLNEVAVESGAPVDPASQAAADEIRRRLWTPQPSPGSH